MVPDDTHSETHPFLIGTYAKDPVQHDYSFDAIAFATVEGIFFPDSFASIFFVETMRSYAGLWASLSPMN